MIFTNKTFTDETIAYIYILYTLYHASIYSYRISIFPIPIRSFYTNSRYLYRNIKGDIATVTICTLSCVAF